MWLVLGQPPLYLLSACFIVLIRRACPPAELAALGNTEFVNTHYPGRTSPLVHAARQGHSFVVMQMILCGGNPKRQGSDWVEFFAAATVTFRRDMAQTIHLMLNLPFLRGVIPVS